MLITNQRNLQTTDEKQNAQSKGEFSMGPHLEDRCLEICIKQLSFFENQMISQMLQRLMRTRNFKKQPEQNWVD